MLTKVISIRNVGRFVNSALPPLPTCAKNTFILGDNAYGKTTICAVLRSLASNDPTLIVGRTRLGGGGPPKVELLLDDGPATFDRGAWTRPVPDIMVFDAAFIAENVYSGDAVDLEQKRNLYRVIIGREGVALVAEEEQLAADSRKKMSEANAAGKAIQSHVARGITLEDFVKLPRHLDIDNRIAAQAKAVEAIREAAQLSARPALNEAAYPAPIPDLESLLAKTLDGIAEDAQLRIAEHIKHHGMGERGEAWLADGVQHITGDQCPFCSQSLRDLALVEAFRKVFGEAYGRLKTAVTDARLAVTERLGDRHIGALETLFETNRSTTEFWSRYCSLPVADPPHAALKAISSLRTEWLRLLDRKQASPQDAVPFDEPFRAARAAFDAGRAAIDAYNAVIKEANQAIAKKKAEVAAGDLRKQEALLLTLHAQKRRHEQEIDLLCSERATALNDKDVLDKRKVDVRAKLEQHTSKSIKPYENRINELLDSFNAGFKIAETKSVYPGGVASSTYQLVINNTGIELGDGATPPDKPSFKNTLSGADRSTLSPSSSRIWNVTPTAPSASSSSTIPLQARTHFGVARLSTKSGKLLQLRGRRSCSPTMLPFCAKCTTSALLRNARACGSLIIDTRASRLLSAISMKRAVGALHLRWTIFRRTSRPGQARIAT